MSFLQPKVSSAPPPPPPVIEDTAATQQQYQDQLRKRNGRASAILTGPSGPGTPMTASKTLLGG
jgi:hypothetical protein